MSPARAVSMPVSDPGLSQQPAETESSDDIDACVGAARRITTALLTRRASVEGKAWRRVVRRAYVFGETRVETLHLLTLMTLPGKSSGGVVIARFSGQAVIFRSSPTVFADTPMSGSTSTGILSGKLPSSVWSAAVPFAL
jgi:hypothetical protein